MVDKIKEYEGYLKLIEFLKLFPTKNTTKSWIKEKEAFAKEQIEKINNENSLF